MRIAQSQWNSISETLAFTLDTFAANKARFALTALGMVVGTASLILVVTIAMTGKDYVMRQIEAIGVNWIFAEYQAGPQLSHESPDPLTISDMYAVVQRVPGIVAASPVVPLQFAITTTEGRQRSIQVLGVNPDYARVRNLVLLAGRFFDGHDLTARNKVALSTELLARNLYGSNEAAVGQIIKIGDLPFAIIGTFRERVETFGRSEVTVNTFVIPYTVSRFFTDTDSVKQLYFSVSDPDSVMPATRQIRSVIQGRHRPESPYLVDNLTELIAVANKTTRALALMLLFIATVTLLVSGIGIMSIMLATVNTRVHEIGIRRAVGATRREIITQFLSEAFLISAVGGTAGILVGLALPLGVRVFTEYRVGISGPSVIVGFGVSLLVGVLFGVIPAWKAAQLDPVESLRSE